MPLSYITMFKSNSGAYAENRSRKVIIKPLSKRGPEYNDNCVWSVIPPFDNLVRDGIQFLEIVDTIVGMIETTFKGLAIVILIVGPDA